MATPGRADGGGGGGGGDPSAWSRRLQVFDQDFDTAMEIWMYQDPAVERLYCDERRARRRKSFGSQDAPSPSQSQSQSQLQAPRPARKRRRRTIGAREAREDVPAPPLSRSCSAQPDEASEAPAFHSSETATPTQAESMEQTAVARVAEGSADVPVSLGEPLYGTAEVEASCDERVRLPDTAGGVGKAPDVASFDVEASPPRSKSGSRATGRFNATDSGRGRVPIDNRGSLAYASRSAPHATTVKADLFQTGSGKSVRVSRDRLRGYEEKILQEEATTAAALGDGMASRSAIATTAGRRQTGWGENVPVATSRLTCYAERSMRGDGSGVRHAVASRQQASLPAGTAVVSLFQTGSGKSVRVSKERLWEYQDKLSESASEACANVPTASDTTVQSLFQTGSGRSVRISKSHLRDYEVKLGEEEVAGDKATSAYRPMAATPALPSSLSTVASLFHTGTGRNVRVSASRLREYEQLQNDECLAETNSPRNPHTADTTNEATTDQAVGAPAGHPSPLAEPTVAGLFQTGSGKTVRVSRARLSEYEAKLEKDDHVNDREIGSTASAQVLPPATVEGLFQTGLGKRARVSEARLQDYKQKLHEDKDAVPESGSSGSDADRSPVGGRRQGTPADPVPISPPDKTIIGMFQTGSGKSVRVSKEELQSYEEKLRQQDSSCEEHGEASSAQVTAVVSQFQTGSGKNVRVSKEGLRAYEERLLEEESVRVERQDLTELLAHEETSVASLFQTGAGNNVRVSKERLREFEAKLYEEEKAERPGTDQCDRGDTSIAAAADEPANRDMRYQQPSTALETAALGSDTDASEASALGQQTVAYRTGFAQRPARLSARSPASPKLQGGVGSESQWGPRPPRPVQYARLRGAELSLGKENQVADANSARGHDSVESPLDNRSKHSSGLQKTTRMQSVVRAMPRPQVRMLGRPHAGSNSRAAPSLRQVGDKRKFHPPVLKSSGFVANQHLQVSARNSLIARPKKAKLDCSQPPAATAFRFREVMKVPFALLQEMQTASSYSADALHVQDHWELASVTAANATFVIFPRDERTPRMKAFHVRSSFDEPYEASEFMGMREIYYHMMNARLLGERTAEDALAGSGATIEWFANHYRWIVWKLASMERAFPRFLLGKYLTKDQVMYQISRRYQRDVVAAERSVVKKVLNRDASSLSCMVLCIASVLPYPKQPNNSLELPDHWQLAVVLTDGWYAVYAVPDASLAAALWRAHTQSSIVGTKIAVWNAALRNSTEGVDPLECAIARGDCSASSPWTNPLLATSTDELTQWPYLELHYNSTRRVGFGERLGVEKLRVVSSAGIGSKSRQQRRLDFSLLKSVPLRSLAIDGGMVRSVRVLVRRISPVLHLQGKDWAIGPRILSADQMHTYMEMRSQLQQQQNGGADASDYDTRAASDMQMPIPFIKVEVECGHVTREDSNSGAADCAFLTVWRPGDELTAGAVREGDEYFVSSLTVGWKVDGDRERGGRAFLRLSSTKGTSFDKIERQRTSGEPISRSVCISIQEATDQYLLDEASGKLCREQRPAIDACVYVLRVSEKEACAPSRPRPPPRDGKPAAEARSSHASADFKATTFIQHAFVTDGTHRLLCVRIPSTEVYLGRGNSRSSSNNRRRTLGSSSASGMFTFRRGGTNTWREGAVICLRGLEISHYDERLGLLDCVLAEGTQIVTYPSTTSHFSHAFAALQRASKDDGSEFLAVASKLQRFVDRRILGMDVAPSQESAAPDEEEADRLTQDLLSQLEGPFSHVEAAEEASLASTVEQPFTSMTMETSEVWTAQLARILLVPSGSSHACDADMAALLIVTREEDLYCGYQGDASASQPVYASMQQLCELKTLLATGVSASNESGSLECCASEARSLSELVADVARLVRQQGAGQSGIGRVCLEVRRVTSERLLNSWKPWQRESAGFWAVTSIRSATRTGNQPVYTSAHQ